MTLKDARAAVGWTQVRLAKESGIVQQQISRLENGIIASPSLHCARRLWKALHRAGLKGVTLDDLFPCEERKAS